MKPTRKIEYRARSVVTGAWWYGTSEVEYKGPVERAIHELHNPGARVRQAPHNTFGLTDFFALFDRGDLDPKTLGEWAGETIENKDHRMVDEFEGDIFMTMNEDGDTLVCLVIYATGDEERFSCGLAYKVLYTTGADEGVFEEAGWDGSPLLLGDVYNNPELLKQPEQPEPVQEPQPRQPKKGKKK